MACWRSNYSAEQIVIIMNGRRDARLGEQEFMSAFNGLFERVSAEQMITLMKKKNPVARLKKSKVMGTFNGLFEKYKTEQMIIIMKGSFGCMARVTEVHGRFQWLVRED